MSVQITFSAMTLHITGAKKGGGRKGKEQAGNNLIKLLYYTLHHYANFLSS